MPIKFQVPSLRVQVRKHLTERESKQVQLLKLLELRENQIHSMAILEQEQQRRKAFVDMHQQGNEKAFEIGKVVLVSQTCMRQMLLKLGSGGRDHIGY